MLVALGRVPAPNAEGDFERCFTASYPRLVGELTVVTISRAEAEEAVQEAFGRLWRAWAQVSTYDNLEAWARRVAINVAIDRWRRDTRLSALDEAACSNVDDPADSTLAVLAELRRLSANQRVALLLHHVVGLSVRRSGHRDVNQARDRQIVAQQGTQFTRAPPKGKGM